MGVPELITRMQEIYRQAEAQLRHLEPLERSGTAWAATAKGLEDTSALLRRTGGQVAPGWPDDAGVLYTERLGKSAATVQGWQETLLAADLPVTMTALAESVATTVDGVRELWNTFVQAVGQLSIVGVDAAAVEAALAGIVARAEALLVELDGQFAEAAGRVARAADGTGWDGPAAAAAGGGAGGAAGAGDGAEAGGPAAGAGVGGADAGAGGLDSGAGGADLGMAAGGARGAGPAGGAVGALGPLGGAGSALGPGGAGSVAPVGGPGLAGVGAPGTVGLPGGIPPVTPLPATGLPALSGPGGLGGGGLGGGGLGVGGLGGLAGVGGVGPIGGAGGGQIPQAGRRLVGPPPTAADTVAGGSGSQAAAGASGRSGGSPRFIPPFGGLGHGGQRGGDIQPGDEQSAHRDRPLKAVPGVPPSLRGRTGDLDATPGFLAGNGRAEPSTDEPLREDLWRTSRPVNPFTGGR